ncbi:hypothetical protein WME99_27935 [Sorangium sp. So ce136]|uniref:hypothetical protein n=1 Tax=Sorangium sp. So ce136 TaxID=3133284 RepID=UPI003F03E6E9
MHDRLAPLDDATAARLLTTIATPHLRDGTLATELTPDLRAALETTYGVAPAPTSEGELARLVLQLLATDPAMQPVIAALLDGPAPEHFGTPKASARPGRSIGVLVAALLVLQTHVRLEREPSGTWKVLVEKEPTSGELLGPIVQKLLALTAAGKTP